MSNPLFHIVLCLVLLCLACQLSSGIPENNLRHVLDLHLDQSTDFASTNSKSYFGQN